MRFGAPVFGDTSDPQKWVSALKERGYSAAYCPVGNNASDDTVRAFAEAAKAANVVIAEVGAWSNPIGPDEKARKAAIEHCQKQLALAERIGARCCVNITGSRGSKWDGPDPRDLTDETFDMIVEVTRKIIDAVNPTRTFYTLETMQWAYPDSPDCYLRLLKAIDRKGLAVHLDPTNLVNSPERFFKNSALIRECFEKLGKHLRSCHGKDIALAPRSTVHLDEVRPGTGGLDYHTYLRELNKLEPDIPLMLEHLPTAEEYALAAEYVRKVAKEEGIAMK